MCHRRDGCGGEDEVFEQELAGVREHGKALRGGEGDRRGGEKDRECACEEQYDRESDVADCAIKQQEAGRDDLEHTRLNVGRMQDSGFSAQSGISQGRIL